MCMSSEFVYELNENKGQFVRIRDKNVKFRSVHVDCPNSYRILRFSHQSSAILSFFNFFMLQGDFLSLFGLFPSYLTSHIIGK